MSHQNALITGGAGFIGSNFVHHGCESSNATTVVLDALTYAGNRATLADLESQKKFSLVEGDICDTKLVSQLLVDHKIDTVIHFAAESHVDRSISGQGLLFKQMWWVRLPC